MHLRTSRIVRALIAAVALMGWGCSDGDSPEDMPPADGGPLVDSGVDAGPDDDGDAGLDAGRDAGVDSEPTRVPPTGIHQPSAAGTAASASHVLRFSFGAPQPMGQSGNDENALNAGPHASGR